MPNPHSHRSLLASFCALALFFLSASAIHAQESPRKSNPSRPSVETEQELLRVREVVWRAWFTNDRKQLQKLLPEDLIAIDAGQEEWPGRKAVLENAAQFVQRGAKLLNLSFPRTEIQLYGDVAILYSLYSFEVQEGEHRTVRSARATEIFVRRNGRWENSGWHLDSGK